MNRSVRKQQGQKDSQRDSETARMETGPALSLLVVAAVEERRANRANNSQESR
jgi:hypothetical protein